jgi:AcrR family transcriptional regulator
MIPVEKVPRKIKGAALPVGKHSPSAELATHFSAPGEEEKLDPRVKRTRQLIVKAFIELITEKDFQELTVQDITERATVNRATFYAHFEDKYALLDHTIREYFQQMLYSRLSVTCELNEDNLRQFILIAFEFLEKFHADCSHSNRKKFEPLIEIQVQVLLREFLSNWFKQLKTWQTKNFPDPGILASIISWAIFGVGLDRSRSEKKVAAEAVADQLLAVITRGLPNFAESGPPVSARL